MANKSNLPYALLASLLGLMVLVVCSWNPEENPVPNDARTSTGTPDSDSEPGWNRIANLPAVPNRGFGVFTTMPSRRSPFGVHEPLQKTQATVLTNSISAESLKSSGDPIGREHVSAAEVKTGAWKLDERNPFQLPSSEHQITRRSQFTRQEPDVTPLGASTVAVGFQQIENVGSASRKIEHATKVKHATTTTAEPEIEPPAECLSNAVQNQSETLTQESAPAPADVATEPRLLNGINTSDPEPDSPFKKVASPQFTNGAAFQPLRLNSEVRLRRRRPNQPIGELGILEWNPQAHWPGPIAIVEQLETLQSVEATSAWAAETLQLIKLLHWTESNSNPQVETILTQLIDKLDELDQITLGVSTVPVNAPAYAQGPLASHLRSFHYDLARRIATWQQVHMVAKDALQQPVALNSENSNLLQQAAHVRIVLPQLDSHWNQYLELDKLSSALGSLNPDRRQQRSAARRTLSRYFSESLSDSQQSFLHGTFDESLVGYLRDVAADDIDVPRFLKLLERHEANPNGYTSHLMNDAYQSLLWARDSASQQLAAHLDGHYRNANFRVSVSEAFLNRMIPQQQPVEAPINENIMGAQINGSSQINNRLFIRLIPDLRQINLKLEANGRVRSLTQARRNGFVVDNVGLSRFQVFKRLAVNRKGVVTDAPYAVSDTRSRVVRMRSKVDSIPVVGWVARRVAQNKIAEAQPATDQYTRQKVESTASQQIETEVESQLQRVEEFLGSHLLQPLVALELEPVPVEMRTTEQRIIMRYRLAGRDQMAAHTSRPRALAQSMMSLQFHESLLNNLLDRIEIRGRKFTAVELVDHLQNVFRSPDAVGAEEVDHDASFEFASYDPMRISFEDQRVVIQLNLKRFRVGKSKTWKNLNVRASYIPYTQGTRLVLVQDDQGISLKGSNLKFRDQVAVRTVFTALFRNQYEMNVLPETLSQQFQGQGLTISQLAVTNGWLGLSLDEPNPSPQIRISDAGR